MTATLDVAGWLRRHDPGLAATRRAARAAVIMPSMFAIGDKVLDNPALATFAAFGSFAMLLLVDFPGAIRDRVRSEALLAIACGLLICLGTLASRSEVLAAITTGAVAFLVIFSGVISSRLAVATTCLLLSFILSVSLAAPVSAIPDRLAGWGLASAAALLAISLLWPAPARNPIRDAAIAAVRALAVRLRAGVAHRTSQEDLAADRDAAVAGAEAAVEALWNLFFATANRPAGLSTSARAVLRLVDEVRWLETVISRSAAGLGGRPGDPHVAAVELAAATVLEQAADLLDDPHHHGAALHGALDEMRAALVDLERATTSELPGAVAAVPGSAQRTSRLVATALNPSFRALELSFIVSQIATNVDYAAAADRRSFADQLLGRQPAGFPSAFSTAQQRAASHLRWESQWLRNSVRGGAALGLAVLLADASALAHSFWVVLGTLSVLRSNALSTGQNLLAAVAGTAAGFVAGGLIVLAVGTNSTILWILLPPAVLVAGLTPAAVSFAAGQAAFTLTLVILFNLLAPVGWKVGLVRVEDIALGGAVSLGVGVLFWPRGAGAELGRALARAYIEGANYLAAAVDFGLGRCDATTPTTGPPTDAELAAAAAARRLDDTFRGFMAERGAKPLSLSQMTSLITGVAGLRLAGDAVRDLWMSNAGGDGDRAAVRRELAASSSSIDGWYERFAAGLAGLATIPEPLAADEVADGRLLDAVSHDLVDGDGHATATAVRVIWTGDQLDGVRRLQEQLIAPAQAAVVEQALS